MNPLYQTGDLVLTRSQERYRHGQIVVYQVRAGAPGAGHHIVHRLVSGSGTAGGPGWATKGDNNPSDDIWTPHDTDIKGVAVLHIPRAGIVLRQFRNPLLYAALGALVIGRILWPTTEAAEDDVLDHLSAGVPTTLVERHKIVSPHGEGSAPHSWPA